LEGSEAAWYHFGILLLLLLSADQNLNFLSSDVILDYLLKNMNNESNQVREALAAVLKSVFSLSYHPDPAQDRCG